MHVFALIYASTFNQTTVYFALIPYQLLEHAWAVDKIVLSCKHSLAVVQLFNKLNQYG